MGSIRLRNESLKQIGRFYGVVESMGQFMKQILNWHKIECRECKRITIYEAKRKTIRAYYKFREEQIEDHFENYLNREFK